jgi:uncharacterized protein
MNPITLDRSVFGGRKVIDVDTRLIEPFDLWSSRAPANMRDRLPRVKVADGMHVRDAPLQTAPL